MGEVFLATSRSRRLVAVKVIRPELLNDSRWRARFRREVASAQSVSGFYTAPVVDDFGIARPLDALPLSRSEILGTPAYMSPEQALGDPVTAQSDVFSLGATLVLAATGAAPFGTGRKVHGRIVYGEEWLPAGVGDLIGAQERTLIEISAELPTLGEETR